MRGISKDKRGNVLDVVFLPVILFGTAIFLFFIYFVFTSIQTPLGENLQGEWSDAPSFLTSVQDGLKVFDSMFPVLLVGLILMLIISAYLIDSYPFFFFISLIVFVVALIIAVVLSNVHADLILNNPAFASIVGDWEKTNWIMNRLPIIVCGVAFAVAIALYTKFPKGATI